MLENTFAEKAKRKQNASSEQPSQEQLDYALAKQVALAEGYDEGLFSDKDETIMSPKRRRQLR